jgi:Alpha-L-arabinofuranosidase
MVSATASRDANGLIHISLSNVDLQESQEIELNLGEVKAKSVTGRILTANNIGDYNSFEKPNVVAPKEFTGAKVNKGKLESDSSCQVYRSAGSEIKPVRSCAPTHTYVWGYTYVCIVSCLRMCDRLR